MEGSDDRGEKLGRMTLDPALSARPKVQAVAQGGAGMAFSKPPQLFLPQALVLGPPLGTQTNQPDLLPWVRMLRNWPTPHRSQAMKALT